MNSSAAKQRRWWGRKRLNFLFILVFFFVLRNDLSFNLKLLNMIICRLDALLMHIFTCSIIHLKRDFKWSVIFANSSRPLLKSFLLVLFVLFRYWITLKASKHQSNTVSNHSISFIVIVLNYYLLGATLLWPTSLK